jgi:sugar lactone lactonase YvrE
MPLPIVLILTYVLTGMNTSAHAGDLTLLWEKAGFNNPESVVYDKAANVLYVSNVNGSAMDKDGNGYISRISLEGEMIDAEWITGLNAPKGLALYGKKLYVADIDTLIEIDIASASIKQRYPVLDAKFLNDVTAAKNGDIYVSDMMLNRIHRLKDNRFEIWLETPALESPNGLLAEGDHLIVGTWGVMTEGFSTDKPGHLKTVSIKDKTINSMGDGTPIGNLDGVEEDAGGGYYVTDWKAGKLLHVDTSGKSEVLLDLGQGSADHEFIKEKNMILIPMMKDNKLLAYKVLQE